MTLPPRVGGHEVQDGPQHGIGRLTIAISTIGARFHQLCLPPPTPGCNLLVLVQDAPPDLVIQRADPQFSRRADLRLIALPGRGVAASRNAALANTETEFLLFGDDDVTLDMAAVLQMRAYLDTHPDQAMAIGQLHRAAKGGHYTDAGQPEFTTPRPLRQTNAGRIGTPTLMLRMTPFRVAGLHFDLRFGLGTRYPLGDEFIFVTDALKAGLQGTHLPVVVGTHPAASSGHDWADQVALRARAAALNRVFGIRTLPYALAFALRHRTRLGGLGGMTRFVAACLRKP